MTDSKLLIFTDIHIRPDGETIIGLDPMAQFQAALAHALHHHPDADRIILMGDLTHAGRVAEFQRLKAALAHAPLPVTLMLGNHDRRDTFLEVFPDTPLTPDGHVQAIVDLGDTRLITLDTLDGPPYPDHHHAGRICDARLEWLRTAIDGASGRRVLVFMHHPPFPVGFPGMDAIRLADDADFITFLKRFPNVAHVFAGHIHRTISGNVGGLAFSIFKSPCHQMPMVLKGGNSALSTDEPGAYGIVLLQPDQVIVHTEDYALAQPPHAASNDALPH